MANNIKELRNQKGWTQKELAEKASLSYWWVCHVENETKEVGMTALKKIAKALGVPVFQLFTPVIGENNQKEGENESLKSK